MPRFDRVGRRLRARAGPLKLPSARISSIFGAAKRFRRKSRAKSFIAASTWARKRTKSILRVAEAPASHRARR